MHRKLLARNLLVGIGALACYLTLGVAPAQAQTVVVGTKTGGSPCILTINQLVINGAPALQCVVNRGPALGTLRFVFKSGAGSTAICTLAGNLTNGGWTFVYPPDGVPVPPPGTICTCYLTGPGGLKEYIAYQIRKWP